MRSTSGGRRRDPSVDARAMTAVLTLVAEQGIEHTTMDAVAERANVSKTALYRRWASKEPLVIDAIIESGWNAVQPDLVSTGDLRSDLVRVIGTETARATSEKMRVLSGVLSIVGQNQELRKAVTEALIEPRARAIHQALHDAVQRGEVPDGTDLELLSSVLPAMLAYRLLVTGQPVTRRWQYDVVDKILLPALPPPG